MSYQIIKQSTVEQPLISVITPSYNVSDYIVEQVESLLNQNLSAIELVIIDDGSTDNTLDILSEYSKKHSEITLISQENSGPSQARNVGLDHFRGDYVYFVDSDDIVPEGALKKLYDAAQSSKADITTGISVSFNSTSSWFIAGHFANGLFKAGAKTLVANPELLYSLGPASKLYKRKIIEDLRMPTHIKIGEDQPFVLEALLRSSKIYTIDQIVYNYRSHENAVSLSQIVKVDPYVTFSEILKSMEVATPLFSKYLGDGISAFETYVAYFERVVRADLWPAIREIMKTKDGDLQKKMYEELLALTKRLPGTLFDEDLFYFRMLTIETLERFTLVNKQAKTAYFSLLAYLFERIGPGPLNILYQDQSQAPKNLNSDKKMRALLKASKRQSDMPIMLFLINRKGKSILAEKSVIVFRKMKTLITTIILRKIMFNLYKTFYKKEKIVFLTNKDVNLTGSFKPVYDEIQKQYSDKEIVCHLKVEKRNFNETKRLLKDAATAKYIFLDDYYRQLYGLKVSKQTEVIQLWHAAGAFKKFGFSAIGSLDANTPEFEKAAHQNYTAVVCSSEEIIPYYAEAFGVPQAKTYSLGVPRADKLLDPEYIEFMTKRIKGKYPIIGNRKVVTYAPTFRGGPKERQQFKLELNIRKFVERFSEDYVLIIKLHPSVKSGNNLPYDLKQDVLSLSDIDMNDLLIVTDVLITDYSSVIFDYSIMEKPMLFYAYDLEEYMEERSFYYNYESFVPGPISRSNDELFDQLASVDQTDTVTIQRFKERFFEELDGQSAQRIVSKIIRDN